MATLAAAAILLQFVPDSDSDNPNYQPALNLPINEFSPGDSSQRPPEYESNAASCPLSVLMARICRGRPERRRSPVVAERAGRADCTSKVWIGPVQIARMARCGSRVSARDVDRKNHVLP